MVATGKYGTLYLLNRDNLGGREQGPNGTDAALRASQITVTRRDIDRCWAPNRPPGQ